MHLVVDGNCENTTIMVNKNLMTNFLRRLAGVADMHIVKEPMLCAYPWPESDNVDALSGFVFLAESSISIHCHPENRWIFLDVFSCKFMDVYKVEAYIVNSCRMTSGRLMLIDRGIAGGQCVSGGVIMERDILTGVKS